jgi:hypothetical protein
MADATAPTVQQRLGVAAAVTVALLSLVYAVVLTIGLLTLPSPDHPIQEPWFTSMEILIIAIAPAMVALTVALHAGSPRQRKPHALAAVAFMSMCAVVTCSVHFAILTLSRQPAFAGQAWAPMVFSFQWPSVAYALDILAWDIFFPLAALSAAATVQGAGLAGAVRALLYASGALAFRGLVGVPLANMQLRNIGIIGYAVLFPVAAALLAVIFHRANNAGAV